MAAAKCSISFKIDYTSSKPIKSAIVTYKHTITNEEKDYHINPAPLSGAPIILYPEIQTPGDYDLKVELTASDGSVVATETSSFKIGNCNGIEIREIFYNHATSYEDTMFTEISFLIEKNGSIMVSNEPAGLGYNDPLESWKSFTAEVGDKITFSTELIRSGSNGKTIGDMFTYSTTGTSGTVVVNPTAPNLLLLDSKKVGLTEGTKATFTFIVRSGLNYALGTNYSQ